VASVTFDGVSKVYDNGFTAVDRLDLDIRDGEFMVLVGPSGCGKTTALRMLAGLEEISDGELVIDETVVNQLAPQKRDIAMVFQNYALYPHLSVYDNMAYGLKIQKVAKQDIRRRVHEIAKVIGLEDLLDRKPRQLSGGQRQRVAMGRAIVRKPKVFLMDEPLSNLDAKLRVQMRSEVARIQHDLKATTVYVTHDQVEAMTMGDRVALMRRGVLQQVDTPMRLYHAPANLFVASFIGSPAMNLFEAALEREGDALIAQIADQRLRLEPEALADPGTCGAAPAARSRSGCARSTSRTRRSRPTRRPSGDCAASCERSRRWARRSSPTSR
jgi:multiple sugar transport system ATP-binding protein